jgi:lipoprotein-anchoring transpeptidase ErfK/SrfK
MRHVFNQSAWLAIMLVWFAGCASQPEPDILLEASAYASEPFPVRVVNRARFDKRLRPTRVLNTMGEPTGTIIVDTNQKLLYFVESDTHAMRYGVAVGGAGRAWSGIATVGRKAEWPAWHPTDDMRATAPDIPRRIAPGPGNPLGARALYLYANGTDTLYRIHGTSEPWTIGTEASSGCIRMFNEDIIDLFAKVGVGSTVIVR